MGEPLRACPICSKCGSKRFIRLANNDDDGSDNVTVKCRLCGTIIQI